jgi:hypothetical protein
MSPIVMRSTWHKNRFVRRNVGRPAFTLALFIGLALALLDDAWAHTRANLLARMKANSRRVAATQKAESTRPAPARVSRARARIIQGRPPSVSLEKSELAFVSNPSTPGLIGRSYFRAETRLYGVAEAIPLADGVDEGPLFQAYELAHELGGPEPRGIAEPARFRKGGARNLIMGRALIIELLPNSLYRLPSFDALPPLEGALLAPAVRERLLRQLHDIEAFVGGDLERVGFDWRPGAASVPVARLRLIPPVPAPLRFFEDKP